jgi:hypothetical protein
MQVDLDNFGRFFFDRDPTYFPVRAAVFVQRARRAKLIAA